MPDREFVAMSKEPIEAALEVAREIADHLRYYREIGLEDIGNSAPATQSAPTAVSTQSESDEVIVDSATKAAAFVPTPERIEIPNPPRASQIDQVGLFGEVVAGERPNSSKARSSVSVFETRDESLEAIRADIGDCRRCRLCEQRKTIVFGEGNPSARLVFVGEGPGADEDASGRPFVGRAGQLLNKIIEAIGMTREEVYIANIVKCRPPLNRAPEPDEVATCEPFLWRQLSFIRPEVIVALGSPAFHCLARTKDSITRARGSWRDWNGIKIMPTFHPAFLLRSPDKKREVWEDMKKVRDYLNGVAG